MSARVWNDAQRIAIEDNGGALLVSAAAGSGKTAVLVERALRMVTRAEDPIPAERLLILTFTNAAAEELRSRIGVALEELLRADPHSLWLRRQRMTLGRAFIGTMDAFCQQLVRQYFTLLDLPPDVQVADPALLAQLSADVLAGVMEEMYADADFARFASLYGRARSDTAAEGGVLALYDFTRSLPHPAAQLRRLADMYAGGAPLAETAWGKELLAWAKTAALAAAEYIDTALELCGEDPDFEPAAIALRATQQGLATLRARVEAGDWDAAAEAASWVDFPTLRPKRNCAPETKEAVTAQRDAAKGVVADLRDKCFTCTEAEFAEDIAEAGPMVAALCRAAQLYADRFLEEKMAERALDFSDFVHLALALLQDEDGARTALAEKVSGEYDAVMVDEYQDTNALQAALYECLARPGGENLFYVGDVKQSIYRFRQANPGIFLAKKEAWHPWDGAAHPAVVTLGHNYRSTPAVVDGVNYVFSRVMSPALGEIDYGEDEKLICGASYTVEGGFAVDVVAGDGPAEAAHVAARIAAMVAAGEKVQEKDALRACRYDDFCILLRARSRAGEFIEALEARGIPVMADLAEELLQTPEVLPLSAALAAIDNPGDDVMLAAAMLGPLFRFSPEEVTRLRAEAPRGRLWGAVAASQDEKVRRFVEEMSFYRALAGSIGVGRLCEVLVDRTGYLSAVAAMEAGAARRENLRRFMAWAAEVGASGRGGLSGFVRLLSGGAGPQPPAAKTVPGHVSILTVHKSKGLEFPFVFLCDAARAFNRMDLSARVQLHAELGIGLALRAGDSLYPTLPALAIRRRAAAEAQSEEMRVLYVALTRARQKIWVSLPAADPADLLAKKLAAPLTPFALSRGRSFADWILPAVLRHPDAAPLLREQLGFAAPEGMEDGGCRISVTVAEPPEATPQGEEAYRLTARADPDLVARLAQSFEAVPARVALAEVPAKLSVSALAKPGGESLRRRPSFMYGSGLTAAERGTAQHTFMQFADLAALSDVEAEVARLVGEGFIDEVMAGAIDRAGVARFAASPLATRLRAADEALREYDFIFSIPAGDVRPGLPEDMAAEPVLVQGIADLLLIKDGAVEIVDYKTDRVAAPGELAELYAAQLWLYRRAIEKRLGLPVGRLTIWSFHLSAEVDVPLDNPSPG